MQSKEDLSKVPYGDFLSTLKKCSYDSVHDVSLCSDEQLKVINFDAVMKWYRKNKMSGTCSYTPCSNDVLYIGAKRIVFIEFKNEVTPNTKDIITKIYDSLLMLFDSGMSLNSFVKSFRADISYSRKSIDYILVLKKEDSNPRKKFAADVKKLGRYDLGRLEGFLFRSIRIYSENEFEEYFLKDATKQA